MLETSRALKEMKFEDRILNVQKHEFDSLALEIFRSQAACNPVYSEYLQRLRIQPKSIMTLDQIPFLPVEVFKHRVVLMENQAYENWFESSGTTGSLLAKHFIPSLNWYHQIAKACFEFHFGPVGQYDFFALLPHYLERKHSSLVSMVNHFMHQAHSEKEPTFFIHDFEGLKVSLQQSLLQGRRTLLWGVRFALLDFADQFPGDYKGLMVIETGGMKGRKRELPQDLFNQSLLDRMQGISLFSEYGMTEMHSQAYAHQGFGFKSTNWLKFQIASPHLPGHLLPFKQRGFVQIIDLANVNTCSFLQTQDIGFLDKDGNLNLLGRPDTAEARGCSLLYDES